ncbi:putative S-adenosyl-L-methionine-dependent methyltransferase, partial [Dillenia turbinata]
PEILQPPLSPSPLEGIARTRIVEENGLMSLEFETGEGIGKLNSTANGVNCERHCPEANQGLDCVIPRPKDRRGEGHISSRYLDTISQMVPDISFGQNTEVVLDIGGGIGSFGASLLECNVSTLTIAPKDALKNQIQLALEPSGLAMFSAFATHHQLYSSQAFDFIHSECGVNWICSGTYIFCFASPFCSHFSKK